MENPTRLGPFAARGSDGLPSLSPQRAIVLEALQRGDTAITAAALADELGLHVNTVREHLDALVERGLAARERGPVAGRGRPAWTYSPAAQHEPDPRVREYAGLAIALAGHIERTSADPVEDALAAGRAWGLEVAAGQPKPGSAVAARRRVVDLLDRMGFQPEADERALRLSLHRCPLLDAATRSPGVICSVHLGMARGVLEALGADTLHTRLDPFAEPGACRLVLAGARSAPGSARPPESRTNGR